MTEEQKHAAQDILATLISFDCAGIDCYQCPFSYNHGSCMVTTAHTKFEEINRTKEVARKVSENHRTYVDTDSWKSTKKGEN